MKLNKPITIIIHSYRETDLQLVHYYLNKEFKACGSPFFEQKPKVGFLESENSIAEELTALLVESKNQPASNKSLIVTYPFSYAALQGEKSIVSALVKTAYQELQKTNTVHILLSQTITENIFEVATEKLFHEIGIPLVKMTVDGRHIEKIKEIIEEKTKN